MEEEEEEEEEDDDDEDEEEELDILCFGRKYTAANVNVKARAR
jgi:hypothetical protein